MRQFFFEVSLFFLFKEKMKFIKFSEFVRQYVEQLGSKLDDHPHASLLKKVRKIDLFFSPPLPLKNEVGRKTFQVLC